MKVVRAAGGGREGIGSQSAALTNTGKGSVKSLTVNVQYCTLKTFMFYLPVYCWSLNLSYSLRLYIIF